MGNRSLSDSLLELFTRVEDYSTCFTVLGILGSLDGFLNVVLEQAEEYNDGKFVARFNDCFLRGNNSKEYTVGSSCSNVHCSK